MVTCPQNPRPKIWGVEKSVNAEKVAYTCPKPRSRWQQRSKTDSCMNKSPNAKLHSIPLPNFKMEGVDVNRTRNENKWCHAFYCHPIIQTPPPKSPNLVIFSVHETATQTGSDQQCCKWDYACSVIKNGGCIGCMLLSKTLAVFHRFTRFFRKLW